MAEQKLIPTESLVTIAGSNISIEVQYLPLGLPNVVSAFIATLAGALNGVSFVEGELIITMKNYPDTDFILNSSGELIGISDDINSYSIDTNGDLIYTY